LSRHLFVALVVAWLPETANAQFDAEVDLGALGAGAALQLDGSVSSGYVGWSVAGRGDLNGDGIPDVAMGAPFLAKGGDSKTGGAYVMFGGAGATTLGTQLLGSLNGMDGFLFRGRDGDDFAGQSVAFVGDVNGDGIGDLLVGAPGATSGLGEGGEGEAYVVYGSPTVGAGGLIDVTALGPASGAKLRGRTLGDETGESVDGGFDLNGDGFPDMVIGAPEAGGLPPTLSLIGQATDTAIGDVNGDGLPDVVMTHDLQSKYSVHLGNGDGSLQPGISYIAFAFNPTHLFLRDYGMDGDLDLVMSTRQVDTGVDRRRVSVMENLGGGIFNLPSHVFHGHRFVTAMDVGDADQDGDVDVALSHYPGPGDPGLPESVVIRNATIGGAVPPSHLPAAGLPRGVVFADLAGDGFPEVCVSDPQAGTLTTFDNVGGSYSAGQVSPMSQSIEDLRATDIDGDGDVDVCGVTSKLWYFDNNGFGLLGGPVSTTAIGHPGNYELADMNGDALLDVVAVDGSSDQELWVARNQGGGDFEAPMKFTLDAGLFGITTGDLDQDGDDDVLVGYGNSPALTVCMNLGAGKLPGLRRGAAYVVFGGTGQLASGDVPLDSLNGTNGFLIRSGQGGALLGSRVSFVGDVNGDSVDDLLISASGYHGGAPGSGAGFLVFGRVGIGASGSLSMEDLTPATGLRIETDEEAQFLGFNVGGVGDVDNDGHPDMAVIAPFSSFSGVSSTGVANVVRGGPSLTGGVLDVSTLTGGPGFQVVGDGGDQIGRTEVSGADLNADGVDDLLLGAYTAAPGGLSQAGKGYVIYGGPTMGTGGAVLVSALDETEAVAFTGSSSGDRAGFAMAGAGDFNQDGRDDVVISSVWGDPGGFSQAGKATLVFGKGGPLSSDREEISLSTGGTQNLFLDAGVSWQQQPYIMLGSATGVAPGLPVGAVTLPLNLDSYLLFTLANPNTVVHGGFLGTLDANGKASASVSIPPAPPGVPAGITLYHAYVVATAGVPLFASNPVPLTFVP